MKFQYLLMLMIAVLLGCSSQPQWNPPIGGGGFFGENDASMLLIEYKNDPAHSIVFFFPFAGGSSTDHRVNPQTQTFSYSGHVSKNGSDNRNVLTYEISSTNPSTISCNDTHYSLDAGTVFQVDDDGNISQLPFVGLQPTKEYLKSLKNFFATYQRTPLAAVTDSLKTQPE